MRVGIIGGSIAACALAVVLKDKFEVTVFERSQNLESRGAGITMPKELLQTLIEKGILDKDTQTFSAQKRSFYCKQPNKPDYGHCIWQQPISLVSLHWDTLFTNLRKPISNSVYKEKCKVAKVTLCDNGLGQITLDTGETREFDLIVFADGAESMGRTMISKNATLTYSGYVAWRGTINFESIKDKSPFIDNIPYYCFDKGHLLAYPIFHKGVKKINWVFYEKIPYAAIKDLGPTNINNFSDEALKHLHSLATSKLPRVMAQVVIDTKAPFMQRIVDAQVERLALNNAVSLGDAGFIYRPHIGSGASTAISDAFTLGQTLSEYSNLLEAITVWEKTTIPVRQSSYALSVRMGDALVLSPILWQGMDQSRMSIWWDQILKGEKWYTPPQNTLLDETVPQAKL